MEGLNKQKNGGYRVILRTSVSSVEKIIKKEKSGEYYDEYIKSKWSRPRNK